MLTWCKKEDRMPFKKRIIFLILICFTLIFTLGWSSVIKENKEAKQEMIQTVMLENFETPDAWVVKFSKNRAKAWRPHAPEFEPSEKWIHWKKAEKKDYVEFSKPEPMGKEGELGTTIMGVRGRFYNKGYNWIAIEPKQDFYMMGQALRLRVWVWGGNFDYDIYAVVKNYRDRIFKLPLGNLKFIGWRQLEYSFLNAPIEQFDSWAPQMKPIQFLRFLIVSKVTEFPDKFGIWFDDLQYDANLYDPSYSGKALEKELDWE